MQNKSIMNTLAPVVSTAATQSRPPEKNVPDQQFTQMLSRQMNDRAATKSATKPVDVPKEVTAKSPDASKAADTSAPATIDSTNSAVQPETDKPAKAEKSATDTKDKPDNNAIALPVSSTDATLIASAAIMALVANAGVPAEAATAATAGSAAAAALAAATAPSSAKLAKPAIEPAILASSKRIDPRAMPDDGPSDAVVRELVAKGTGEFANVLQSAKTLTTDKGVALVRLVEQPIAGIGLQPVQQTALTMAAPAGVHPGNSLAPQVNNDAWNQALGQRMVWMVAGAEQSATLTLNPPDLGPLQVVLNVSNGQADASFFAAQPEVRQALEAALPKLREMLGEAGISLGQANVSSGSPNPQSNSERNDNGTRRSAPSGVSGTTAVTARRITSSGNGMVDTFA